MRYSIFKIILGLTLTALPFSNAVAYSLKNNANVAHPITSKLQPFSEKTNLYVLFDNSEVALKNLTFNVQKDVGSNLGKKIFIYYIDKLHYQSAVKIKKVLLKQGINKNNINILKTTKKSFYPLYVEVQEITGQKYPCPSKIGEQVIFSPYKPCAINSNNKVQLKN